MLSRSISKQLQHGLSPCIHKIKDVAFETYACDLDRGQTNTPSVAITVYILLATSSSMKQGRPLPMSTFSRRRTLTGRANFFSLKKSSRPFRPFEMSGVEEAIWHRSMLESRHFVGISFENPWTNTSVLLPSACLPSIVDQEYAPSASPSSSKRNQKLKSRLRLVFLLYDNSNWL